MLEDDIKKQTEEITKEATNAFNVAFKFGWELDQELWAKIWPHSKILWVIVRLLCFPGLGYMIGYLSWNYQFGLILAFLFIFFELLFALASFAVVMGFLLGALFACVWCTLKAFEYLVDLYIFVVQQK
jgi:hypothetical protein